MSKRWIWNILKLIVAGAIFYYLLRTKQLDVKNLRSSVRRVDLFGASVVLIILGTLITVLRWKIILASQNTFLSYGLVLKLTLVGCFFGTALPGTLSGDFVKAYYLAKGEQQKTTLISSIFCDRLLGLYSLILIAVLAVTGSLVWSRISGHFGLWTQPLIISLGTFVSVLFVGMTVIGIVLINRKCRRSAFIQRMMTHLPFRDICRKIYDAFQQFGQNRNALISALVLSFAASFISYVGVFTLAQMLGIREIKLIDYFFILPVGMLAMAIPIAPSGLGVGEIGFSQIFLLFGSARGAEVAVMFHIIYLATALGGGGLVYIFSDFNVPKTKIQ